MTDEGEYKVQYTDNSGDENVRESLCHAWNSWKQGEVHTSLDDLGYRLEETRGDWHRR